MGLLGESGYLFSLDKKTWGELMHLTELNSGTDIIYQIQIKKNIFEFNGKVLGGNDNCILLSPVCVNGRVFRFDNSDTRVSVIYKHKNKVPIIWKSVNCKTILHNSQKIYQVSQTEEGVEYNRRATYRIDIMVDCVAKMCNGTRIQVGQVKDISKTGFSILLDKDISDTINTGVTVLFTDNEYDISIYGMIVRKAGYSKNKVLYGCRLIKTSENFNNYMSNKQRTIIEMLQSEK